MEEYYDQLEYLGEWKGGKREGQGEQVIDGNTRFKGGFRDNLRQGRGKIIGPESISRQGIWIYGEYQQEN